MTKPTRQLAHTLRHEAKGTELYGPPMCAAAAAIDALLDAIEAGGMVQPRPAPVMDLGPLRPLRAWHDRQGRIPGTDLSLVRAHEDAVNVLNAYFPSDDQL